MMSERTNERADDNHDDSSCLKFWNKKGGLLFLSDTQRRLVWNFGGWGWGWDRILIYPCTGLTVLDIDGLWFGARRNLIFDSTTVYIDTICA